MCVAVETVALGWNREVRKMVPYGLGILLFLAAAGSFTELRLRERCLRKGNIGNAQPVVRPTGSDYAMTALTGVAGILVMVMGTSIQ